MSNRIPQSFIEDVLTRTDIVEIINSRLSLARRGANYLALCPFHQEKTPSFTVSQNKQFYYCFGCGAHGNAISFLMQYDRMEFIDAIQFLAAQLGLELPKTFESSSQSYAKFYEVMQKVSQYYQKELRQHQTAIDYLKSRKVTGKIAKEYAIGYAPSRWNNLAPYFNHQPELMSILKSNGLLNQHQKNKDRYFDRFRQRIMFPIRDIRGRVIAFGGRSLGDEQPKYMNSPETPIFHKSNELYGLYEARKIESQLKQLIMVEGYMDVIALAKHGIHYAVATLGTATTRQHIQKALRYTSTLIFCFDGDTAGQQAAWKALLVALPLLRDGVHIRFLFLPQGEDPDSLIHKIAVTAFEEKISKAHSLETVFFTKLQRDFPIHHLDGKAHFAREACQLIDEMPNGLYQKLMVERVADILQVDVDALKELRQQKNGSDSTAQKDIPQKLMDSKKLTPALIAIALLLQQPKLNQFVKNTDFLASYYTPERDLFLRLCEFFNAHSDHNIGHVLEKWQQPNESQLIAELSARHLPYSAEAYASEFKDALGRLEQQTRDHLVKQLILKAKQQELTELEKQELRHLLENKARTELD